MTMERLGGLRDSGCVCAAGRGPSGASSSSPAAHQRSSCPSAAAAWGSQSTDAPRHFLVFPERRGGGGGVWCMSREENKTKLKGKSRANVNRE